MALSQVQCLDDNHVNPRTHESKPEFLYCEDQRLALEAFLLDGREALGKYLCASGLRGFLSDPELETLAEVVAPYDPGSELFFPENAEDDDLPLSLHYWPELSDTSVPQMDLSWPGNISYRGVTRTAVYTQPPLEGQVHIKEVVRKMIAQAQKVIAVVMDVFTDVDIFRDLLDAGFKRKVSVYILLERTTLPHFESMCQRANMHAGHLKNLRVRCTDGEDFYSRSCTKVRGRMGHRFMFIDGDKAVSGSYSFTWMSSRLDKNLITVVTGQAVEAFDRLFCVLYATSSSVDLRQVTTEPEPKLEPLPEPVPAAAPSAAMARKLYSPKYALLALSSPNPVPADPKEIQSPQTSKNPETKHGRRKTAGKEPIQEDPPLHPGLTDLEKVCMMSYLPTWPEPDPASDVIGFINIRDNRKQNQVHQRSEMFETSQAIRFSSPFSMPKETLPEVATLRQVTAKPGNAEPVKTSEAEPPASGPPCDSDTTVTAAHLRPPDARSQAVHARPRDSCEMTPSARSPTANDTTSSSTPVSSFSENGPVSAATSRTVGASSPSSSSSIPPLTSSSTTPNPPLTSSSSACPSSTPPPPVPKPRTVQLVMKGAVAGEGQKLPEFSVIGKLETSAGFREERALAAAAQASAERSAPETAGHKAESDVVIAEAPKAASVNIREIIPTDVERETSMSTDCKSTSRTEGVVALQAKTKASERESTGCEFSAKANETRESVSECKAHLARAHAPQTVSYSELTAKDVCALEITKAPCFTPSLAFQEQIPKAQASTHTPERPRRLHLYDTHVPDFRTPTPDGFLPPTPDSRTPTPDFRTPTSDGYISPKTDSEEYYECNDSLLHETVFDQAYFRNPGATEAHVSFTHGNTPNAASTTCAATLGVADSSAFESETESWSGCSASSLSSLKGTAAHENVVKEGKEDERGSVDEGDYQETERRADHLQRGEDSTWTEGEVKAPKRKRALNQSGAEKPVDTGAAPGESTNERTAPTRLSTGDLKLRKSSSERKTPDKEKAEEREALGPSGDTDGQKV
uniref:Family with sequence similarity 83 member G n=1 Tax=Cyclopterus lumpus TaxID=8103 RepID=A0A8C2X217_CYCLU